MLIGMFPLQEWHFCLSFCSLYNSLRYLIDDTELDHDHEWSTNEHELRKTIQNSRIKNLMVSGKEQNNYYREYIPISLVTA